MTTYRDRHLAGEYFGTIGTTVTEPEPEPAPEPEPVDDDPDELPIDPETEPQVEPVPGPAPEPEPELEVHPLDNLMRKELVAIADQHGIPNYGTRAQLLQRLKDRGA